MDLIGSSVLASPASTVTFSSITNTYRDLMIVFNGGVDSRTGQYLEFNGNVTNANYSNVYGYSNGSGGGSNFAANRIFAEVIENDSNNNAIIEILDYAVTDKHKTSIIRVNNPSVNGVEMRIYRWANTSAINSINLVATGANWLAGSSFYIYGIAG